MLTRCRQYLPLTCGELVEFGVTRACCPTWTWPISATATSVVTWYDEPGPMTTIMYEKARIGRQVMRNAELKQHRDEDTAAEIDPLLVPVSLDSELLAPAALSAIALTVPQTDEVAVALMEALNHKDPRVRRAASQALASAVHGATEGSSSEK